MISDQALGKITTLHTPGGHGVRVDSHVYAGYVIPHIMIA
jgi:biotin carboxylase